MDKPPLIRLIEDRFSRKPPREPVCRSSKPTYGVREGFSVVIIGGGIAGPAFARRVLSLVDDLGLTVKITLISRPSCNFCGGLITNLARRTMLGLYNYEPGPEVVLSEIEEVVLVNPCGSASVQFEFPLASVFRTSRFGPVGLDDNFRRTILAGLSDRAEKMLSVVEPGVATSVELPSRNARGSVTFAHSGGTQQVEADLVVIATGLRSLESKLLRDFSELTGYVAPPTMPACVTELDLSGAGGHSNVRRMLILNGIIENAVIGLVPKHLNWITVAALNKVLTIDDLSRVFAHPAVRPHIQIDHLESRLACHKVCASGVFMGPARNFYGDGWVVLGDLTGYGRVLKDGYFAALLGADIAAHTAVLHGCSREDFARHYHGRLKDFGHDNRAGMRLFFLNNTLARSEAFNHAIVQTISSESVRHPYGGLAHSAFRALSTGELSYLCVASLFVAGVARWSLANPLKSLRTLCRSNGSKQHIA